MELKKIILGDSTRFLKETIPKISRSWRMSRPFCSKEEAIKYSEKNSHAEENIFIILHLYKRKHQTFGKNYFCSISLLYEMANTTVVRNNYSTFIRNGQSPYDNSNYSSSDSRVTWLNWSCTWTAWMENIIEHNPRSDRYYKHKQYNAVSILQPLDPGIFKILKTLLSFSMRVCLYTVRTECQKLE